MTDTMADSPGMIRKAFGVFSLLVGALLVLLMARQAWLWTVTADLFYLTSGGFYAVLTALCAAGVAWGFRRGEAADQLFTAGVAPLMVVVGIGALYYWITGLVIGSDRLATAAGIGLMATGVVLGALLFGIPYTARKVGTHS